MLPTPYHILVIDGDDLCAFLDDFLSAEGYIVDCAPSANAIYELLTTTHPDLVISDLGVGQDRLADFRLLTLLDGSDEHRGLPVLFCTAWDERVMAPQVVALGRPYTALLAKPFDLDVLLAAIVRACGGRSMTPLPRLTMDSQAPRASDAWRVRVV